MPDLVENANFDVEAQQSLLRAPPENTARQTMQRLILVLRSTELFKLAADTLPAYSSIDDLDESEILQDSEIVADDESLPEPREAPSDVSHASQDQNSSTLQLLQKEKITEIVNGKKLSELREFGGVQGVAEALNTDLENGRSIDQEHIPQCKTSKLGEVLTIIQFIPGACNNYTIFLLSFAAVLSLTFGISEEGLSEGWYDGAIVIVAILVIIIVTTMRNYLEQRPPKNSEKYCLLKGGNMKALVIRGGQRRFVPAADLFAGDIVLLGKGHPVPGDGIFIDGEALELDSGSRSPTTIDYDRPFLFYGSRVIHGNARMIVTEVSMGTEWGEEMSTAMESPDKKCTLETCLHRLSTCIHITGLLIAILLSTVLFLRFTAGQIDEEQGLRPDTKDEPARVTKILDCIKGIVIGTKGTARILTTLLSISLVGIMEGMPVAISLGITRWNRKILEDKALEKDLLACVKMASVTTICTDKLGGLRIMTEHDMIVDRFNVSGEFVSESSIVSSNALESLCDGIGTSVMIPPNGCELKLVPVILWAKERLGMKAEIMSEKCRIINVDGTNPFEQRCRVLMERNGKDGMELYLHYKGRPQDILPLCLKYYDSEGKLQFIDAQMRRTLERSREYMLDGQEVIAYAFQRAHESDDGSLEANDLVFLGMIGLKKINQRDTRDAISTLRDSNIRTVLVSEDDVSILETDGQKCGLNPVSSDNLVVTGEEFRSWSNADKSEKVDKICIMGNCLPSDKVLLVKWLRKKGNVVAFLGQRTNDAPALKEADIGLSVGTWSSEIVREVSDIIIWDEDFSFPVTVIQKWRCIYENIRKFVQFELIMNIASLSINFIGTIFLGDAPLTPIQLFWLNLTVTVAGGLALLTEPPTERLMKMLPINLSGHVITKAMWRNIAVQASYQTTVFVTLQQKGHAILGVSEERVKSMIYYGFFICQFFNKFIAREPEDKNLLKGLCENSWFPVALVLFMISLAIAMAAEDILGTSTGFSWALLAICFLIGLVCWLFDWGAKSVSSCIANLVAD